MKVYYFQPQPSGHHNHRRLPQTPRRPSTLLNMQVKYFLEKFLNKIKNKIFRWPFLPCPLRPASKII